MHQDGEQFLLDVAPAVPTLIDNQRFRDYEMPANSDTTFWSDLASTARRRFSKAEDYRNWLGQLRDVPRYFREQMDEMRAGAARGFTPPAITMAGSPGNRCCSEKIRIDTKNSVGISWRMRLARKLSMMRFVSRAQRSVERCAAEPGSILSGWAPDQRCTAGALHRVRDTRP